MLRRFTSSCSVVPVAVVAVTSAASSRFALTSPSSPCSSSSSYLLLPSSSFLSASQRWASFKVQVPGLGGESVKQGKIASIEVKVGQEVPEDTILAVIESDKSSVEVRTDKSGVIKSIDIEEGQMVDVGAPVATIEEKAVKRARRTASAPSSSAPAQEAPAAQQQAEAPSSASSSQQEQHTRTPMIRFRYGKREEEAAAVPAQSVSAAPVAAAVNTGVTQYPGLPVKFWPRQVDEEEIECLRLGGAVLPLGVKPPKPEKKKK